MNARATNLRKQIGKMRKQFASWLIAWMVLTTVDEVQALEEARYFLARLQQAEQSATVSHAMMEMVTTIMVYQFSVYQFSHVPARPETLYPAATN